MTTFRKLDETDGNYTYKYLCKMIDTHIKYLHSEKLKERREAQVAKLQKGGKGADPAVDSYFASAPGTGDASKKQRGRKVEKDRRSKKSKKEKKVIILEEWGVIHHQDYLPRGF